MTAAVVDRSSAPRGAAPGGGGDDGVPVELVVHGKGRRSMLVLHVEGRPLIGGLVRGCRADRVSPEVLRQIGDGLLGVLPPPDGPWVRVSPWLPEVPGTPVGRGPERRWSVGSALARRV